MFGRYADFIVNEVDMDGNVVRLTSLDVSPEMVCLHFDSHSPHSMLLICVCQCGVVCCCSSVSGCEGGRQIEKFR